jgi:hypothetical protein
MLLITMTAVQSGGSVKRWASQWLSHVRVRRWVKISVIRAGDRLSHFEILEKLGEGGMGALCVTYTAAPPTLQCSRRMAHGCISPETLETRVLP